MRRLLALAVTVLTLAPAALAADTPARPNIIIIVAYDLGYAYIGAQEQSKDVKTPNVDTIAKNGTRFTAGYVSCPVCSPTRAGIMTGRYQQRFGHEMNPGPNEAENFGLPTDQVTIAQALKSAGYNTGMVGKWHLGFRPEMHPTRRGFDEFFGFLAGAHSYTDAGEGKNALMRGTVPVNETDYLTDAFGREAGAFVDKHAKDTSPFFLYLAFNAVHTPQQCPQKYIDRFPDEKDPKRRNLLGMLSALDDAVGLLLGRLKEHDIEKNTLIFFVSDNGGPTQGNGSRNTPFSGVKGQVLEGGVREPMMIQWPAALPAGKVIDVPVIALDFFPTALAAAGVEKPEGVRFDGVNLLPLLKGESNALPHEFLFWRFGPQWAVRDARYKLLQQSRGQDSSVRLYDLQEDPAESKNLAAEKLDDVKRLKAAWDEWNKLNIAPAWRDTRDASARPGRAGRRDRNATSSSPPVK